MDPDVGGVFGERPLRATHGATAKITYCPSTVDDV
jgi:hypothetical protein